MVLRKKTRRKKSVSKPEQPLEAELTCSVCLQLYVEPSALPCGHSFCTACITALIDNVEKQGAVSLSCPECRAQFSGLEVLQRNFKLGSIVENFRANSPGSGPATALCDVCLDSPRAAIKTCLKCEVSMCAPHLQPHLVKEAYRSHALQDPSEDLNLRRCQLHGKLLEYYCLQDKTCVCVSCTIEGQHRNHELKSFPTAQRDLVQKLEGDLKTIRGNQKRCEKLQQQGREVQTETQATDDELREKAKAILANFLRRAEQHSAQLMRAIEAELRKIEGGIEQSLATLSQQGTLLKEVEQQIQDAVGLSDPFHFLQNYPTVEGRAAQASRVTLNQVMSKNFNKEGVLAQLDHKRHFPDEWLAFLKSLKTLIDPAMDFLRVRLTFDSNAVKGKVNITSKNEAGFGCKCLSMHYYESASVLSSQSFSRGVHRWLVQVTGTYWSVGVCNTTKQFTTYTEFNQVYLRWSNNTFTYHSRSTSQALPDQAQLGELEVRLDYEGGTLGFYRVSGDAKQEMVTIKAPFTGKVFAFFESQACKSNCVFILK
ncbi:TRI25 ligase, partial [Amia calva]|nr:TRI25 ligase [Amia calva]